ncbi:hypothetical protein EDB84DRAFT_1445999 [Lactarius hengduanensis]|nr:hypothetical protein EDB84DRAFT_1445999 [Lactarius hengduanensis]
MRVKKRLRQKKNDEDCCFCRPHTRPPHRRRQSRPVAIHSRRPCRRPLCRRFVTGRFVVVVVVVVVAVVVAPSLHGRRRILRAADSRRYCAVVVSWSRHRRAVVAPLSHHLPAIGGRRASRCRAACTTPRASSRGARLGVVVVACGRSLCVGVASVVGIGEAGGGHSRGSTLDLEKKKVWRRLNLRRGKVSLTRRHVDNRAPFYFNTSRPQASTFQRSTTERTEQLNWYYPIALPLHADPPLLQGQHRCGHAIHHTTTPCSLAPTPLAAAGLRHYIKIPKSPSPPPPPPCSIQARGRRLQPIATPPPPPPLTARKSRHNATPTWRATPTATTPTTTVTRQREQHGGRNAGEPTIMAMTPLVVPTTINLKRSAENHPMIKTDFHPISATDFHPIIATDFHPKIGVRMKFILICGHSVTAEVLSTLRVKDSTRMLITEVASYDLGT